MKIGGKEGPKQVTGLMILAGSWSGDVGKVDDSKKTQSRQTHSQRKGNRLQHVYGVLIEVELESEVLLFQNLNH